MHKLTIQQRVENLEEVKQRLVQKRTNIEKQISGIENKICLLMERVISDTSEEINYSDNQRKSSDIKSTMNNF